MKKLLTIFILSSLSASAQLGLSEQSVIKNQGKYKERAVEQSTLFLYYDSEVINDFGKIVPELILYMIDRKTNICYRVVYSTAKSAANFYVKMLNKMGVRMEGNVWEDFKNKSKYVLKTEGNIVSIDHSFTSSKNSNSDLDICQEENDQLKIQIDFLKKNNADLINNMGEMTAISENTAERIEQALHSLKEKDAKLLKLQKALKTKDSITELYIKQLSKRK